MTAREKTGQVFSRVISRGEEEAAWFDPLDDHWPGEPTR